MSHSVMYTLYGTFEDLGEENFNDKPFFRKMSRNKTEHKIAQLIMDNPHPNIVNIYRIGPEYIDMELLDDYFVQDTSYKLELLQSMTKAKEHLQSLGIIYIDWKPDNTGISKDDHMTRKLFDFDVSGLIDVTTKTWISEPLQYFLYLESKKLSLSDPYDIDNYSFDSGLVNNMFNL